MGKKDWQNLDGSVDVAEMTLAPNRGRGWRILSGVLFVAAATFAAAYYLPLYRAHSSLNREYRTLSTEAGTQHKQLEDTLETLKQVSAERDRLNSLAGSKKDTAAQVRDAESLERDLQAALKKFVGNGKLQVSRDKEKLVLSLSAPALVQTTSGDLTDAGKKVLCQFAGSVKSGNTHLTILGYAASVAGNPAAAWKMAAVRAASAAQLVSESCGVDPRRVNATVHEPTKLNDDVLIAVEVTPAS